MGLFKRSKKMYQTINKTTFHDLFEIYDRKENFSYEGLNALFEYLEEYEEATGEKIELDVIALCCDYSEDKIEDVLQNYNLDSLEDLKDETQVIWHDDVNVLYQIY